MCVVKVNVNTCTDRVHSNFITVVTVEGGGKFGWRNMPVSVTLQISILRYLTRTPNTTCQDLTDIFIFCMLEYLSCK